MEVFDNITKIVRDDLTETIKPHGRVSIVMTTGNDQWGCLTCS